jgi:hypothetical protein
VVAAKQLTVNDIAVVASEPLAIYISALTHIALSNVGQSRFN